MDYSNIKTEEIVLGAGCFWCTEAVFKDIKGVLEVEVGYTGGEKPNPTYKEICTGTSGHVEVAKLIFDPSIVSLNEILKVFWFTHDPTSLDKQGADRGTQYKSVIFYNSEEQKNIAEKSLKDNQSSFEKPLVTVIWELGDYFKAENYHQDYYKYNKNQPYCAYVVAPKIKKRDLLFEELVEEKE